MTRSTSNTLWFNRLPDGWINSFCTKGGPQGKQGFLFNAHNVMIDKLQGKTSPVKTFATDMMVSSVLPVKDPETLLMKELTYKDKKTNTLRTKNVLSFVHNQVYLDNISPEQWCKSQIKVLKSRFPMIRTLTYGGDVSLITGTSVKSLDAIFPVDDVANLAFSLYEDEIRDGSFFAKPELLQQYFLHTNDVLEIFKNQGLIA